VGCPQEDHYGIEGDRIILKGLGAVGWIVLGCKGLIHLKGEHGRLEIRCDPDGKKRHAHISFEAAGKAVRAEWTSIPKQPKGGLVAGVGINNLIAIYVENGLTRLINGRPLKATSHYWRLKMARYQSTLNRYGLKTSRRLRRMYSEWRSKSRHTSIQGLGKPLSGCTA